jgi:peroxiredoxin
VGVEALARALGATPRFDSERKNVRFDLAPAATLPAGTAVDVGQVAPDFRLTRLDGTPVALSDFRGKRVLINSWASW